MRNVARTRLDPPASLPTTDPAAGASAPAAPLVPTGSQKQTGHPDIAGDTQVAEWQRLATPKTQAVLRIQAGILHHLRAVLVEHGFLESLPPIMGPVTDPGTRGAKQATVDHYGSRYKVMSSAILYKQLMLHAADAVFMMAPCIRLEPHDTAHTGRHLTEFWQCDLEIRDGHLDDAVAMAETLIREVGSRIWTTHSDDLAALDAPRWDLKKPFQRLTHQEAVATLRGLGHAIEDGTEIPWEAERALSAAYDTPIVITHYPRGARGFYDRLDPVTGLLLDFDVLYPGGYGEAVSGAERQHDLETVVERMREAGEDPKKYGWYLEMLRDGTPPSAGFGLGVERLTRFICGLETVTEARPFPKVAGKVSP